MTDLAPVLLFTYNRPAHTLRTLTALSENHLAGKSELFIYVDGLKENPLAKDSIAHQEMLEVIRSKNWCKNTIIVESNINKGCAASIVSGVTELLNSNTKVIVLEDDMVTAPSFLTYMNDGLNLFANDQSVSSINAYAETFVNPRTFPPYFSLNGSDCWGWATWKDRWADFIFDAKIIKEKIITLKKEKIFEYGHHMALIDLQIAGKIDAWDMQWHGSNVIKGRKGIYPNQTFVRNIGLDGSGTHGIMAGLENTIQLPNNRYTLSLPDFVKSGEFMFSQALENRFKKLFKKQFSDTLFQKITKKTKRVLRKLHHLILKK